MRMPAIHRFTSSDLFFPFPYAPYLLTFPLQVAVHLLLSLQGLIPNGGSWPPRTWRQLKLFKVANPESPCPVSPASAMEITIKTLTLLLPQVAPKAWWASATRNCNKIVSSVEVVSWPHPTWIIMKHTCHVKRNFIKFYLNKRGMEIFLLLVYSTNGCN